MLNENGQAAGQTNSQDSTIAMNNDSAIISTPTPGPELPQSAIQSQASEPSAAPDSSADHFSSSNIPENAGEVYKSSLAPDASATQSGPSNISEEAGDESKSCLAHLEPDDSVEITKVPPEVVDLTDDGPDDVFGLPFQQVAKEESVGAVSVPESGTGVVAHSIEVELLLKSENALPELKGSGLEDLGDSWHVDLQESADETEETMMMLQAAANRFRNPSQAHPSSSTGAIDDDINMIDPDAVDSDSEAVKRFQDITQYGAQRIKTGKFNDVDEVDHEKARRAEKDRIRNRRIDDAYHGTPESDDDSMFYPDVSPRCLSTGEDAESKSLAVMSMNEDSETEVKQVRTNGKVAYKKGKSRKRAPKSKAAMIDGRVTKPNKTNKRGQKLGPMNPIPSLLRNSNDLIAVAQANQQKPKQPTFTNTVKAKALNELISSMPEEQQKLHNIDRKELEAASKKFTGWGVVKADGKGGWRLKGMKSSLHHYQLLGAGFMRDREKRGKPNGGMIADQMGLGKTVLAIANIIDGQVANANAKTKATLVVAPSGLLTQWMEEIDKHAESSRIRRVLLYRSESQYHVRDPVSELGQHDVVITSYHEVLRSWPKNSPPLGLFTPQAKADWWEKQCREKLGLLHQVEWQRIVLDEAQAIKNYLSRTSEAVCQLKGRYRWAISGTPVQNKLEEFYAFFRFIGIPQTGSFPAFKKNFCKKGSKLALQRLQSMLSRYMLRRTHDDQLFGAPILTLPNIRSETKILTFSHIEKAIYGIIRERFVLNVKACVQAGSTEKKYQSIFVLLLRLRQVTAHCLLVQNTLKELLEESDLERLWKLTEDESHPEDYDLIRGLKHSLVKTVPDGSQPAREEETVSPMRSRFRMCLQELRQSGKWQEIADRTLCALCRFPPVDAHVTSCGHIYCCTCLKDLQWNAESEKTKNGRRCVDCGAHFDREERCSRGDLPNLEGHSSTSARSGSRRGASNPEETDTNWLKIGGPVMQSSKTKASVSQIEHWLQLDESRNEERSKIIVFTQVSQCSVF